MKKISLILVTGLMFAGCSFKTQTNPLPSQNKVNVPSNYEATRNGVISKEAKEDFNRYAMLILTNKEFTAESIENYDEMLYVNQEYHKAQNPHLYQRESIWQTGLNIANRKFEEDLRWKR